MNNSIKTILVVDDNYDILRMAEKFLSKDYKVVAVTSGEKALKYLEKRNADMILLDIEMPDMDGYTVMKHIKDNESTRGIPVIFLTANNEPATEMKCLELGAVDFIAKPFVSGVAKLRIARNLELEDYRKNLEAIVNRQTMEITAIQQEVIFSMASLIESRDGGTGEHVKRTCNYVKMIAKELIKNGLYTDILNDEYIDYLCKAAPMHDIGKITVSDNILQKPGKLTVEEFEQMKIHVEQGEKIIRSTLSKIENEQCIEIACQVASFHHEKWDGQGYPSGLKGEEIPLCARIMAIADVFDALVSKRCYKDAIPVEDAFRIIENSSESHFDPTIVKVFLNLKDEIKKNIKNNDEHSKF